LPRTNALQPPAIRALALAFTLGVLGDVLFEGQGAGLNLLLFVAALALAWRLVASATGSLHDGQARWLLVALGFASCFAVRDASFLGGLDFLAMLFALFLPTLVQLVTDQRRARLVDVAISGAWTIGMLFAGPIILVATDADWSALRGRGRIGPLILGALAAGIVVLVFGAIFSSADPTFASIASLLTQWNLDAWLRHTLFAGFIAWLSAGALRAWLWKRKQAMPAMRSPSDPPVAEGAALPVMMVVGAMALVFLLFVTIQIRYLFGGAAMVQSLTGLTYAEYARHGFFEMVTASGLAIPVLFGADALLDGAGRRATLNLRRLGSVQLMLILLVMISALSRMRLYIGAYGLTSERVVATAILIWLGSVTVWFANTAMRGRRERFMMGTIVSGFAVLATLNAVNPELLIVRTNVAHAQTSEAPFDAKYIANLSADALPWLRSHIDDLPQNQRCEITELVDQRLKVLRLRERDWRSWNLARTKAASL
jgi:hypothetical protein